MIRFFLIEFPRRHPRTVAAGLVLGIFLGLVADRALGLI